MNSDILQIERTKGVEAGKKGSGWEMVILE